MISAVLLINRAGTMVLPFLSLYFTVELGFTVSEAGRLMALYGGGSAIGSYLGGWLTDRIGALRTQYASLVLGGVGFVWLVTLRDLTSLSVGVFVVSLLYDAFRPAAMAAIGERAPREVQVRAFALLRLAANVGMAIGPAAGGWLALHDYHLLFYGDALTCWAAAAALYFMLGAKDVGHEERRAERAAARSPLGDRPFLWLLLLSGGMAMVLFQIFTTLPIYLRHERGMPENAIGSLLAFNALLIVALEMVLIHWAQRFRRMAVIAVGAVLFCGGLGIVPLGSSTAFLLFTVVVWTFGEMLSLPMMNAVVAERASRGSHGRYMGLFTLSFSIAFILSPALGTMVYERFGPDVLWYGIGALGLPLGGLALALMGDFRRRKRPPEAGPADTIATDPG